MVSGTTQVVAVIGHPIAQVKSPDNFNRYFAEQHMDSVMIPVDIAPTRWPPTLTLCAAGRT